MTEMRTRESSLPPDVETAISVKTLYNDDGSVLSVTDESVNLTTDMSSAIMTDYVIENFYARSKNGEIFNNPMSKTIIAETRVFTDSVLRYDSGVNKVPPTSKHTTIVGKQIASCPWLGVPNYDPESRSDRAITTAYAGATSQKASALVTLGEGKETVTGIIDVFQRLFRIIYAVKKFKWKLLKKELKPSEIADFWMEVRYGIRPIFFDVQQILEALKCTSEVGDRFTSRGHESIKVEDADVYTYVGGSHDTVYERTASVNYTARAGVLSRVDQIGMTHLFGIHKIPSAIYDLATLSFVLDWFFNVGDLIAAHTPEGNLTTLSAWLTETTSAIQTMKCIRIENGEKLSYFVSGTKSHPTPCILTTTTVVRTPISGPPFLPRFKLNLNWAKLIDLSIIGRNLTASLRRR